MSNFNEAAVNTILDQVVSACMNTGRFENVNLHEPKQSPGSGLQCAVWVDSIFPVRSSSLIAVSGALRLRIRIYIPFVQQPYDMIDPSVLSAVTDLISIFSGNFDFGQAAQTRAIDIFGGEGSGEKLSAQAGYLEMDRKVFRIMTVQLPIVINDMWQEAG